MGTTTTNMRALGVLVVISLALLVPALRFEDDDNIQEVVSRLDDKLQSLEKLDEDGLPVALEENNNDDDDAPVNHEISASSKVAADVSSLEESLDASDMPRSVRSEIKSNLNAIKKDAENYASATGARRSALAKALTDRVKALRMQMEESQETHKDTKVASSSEDARDIVTNDISRVLADISSSDLPQAARNRATHILEEMAEKVGSGGSANTLLAEARELRSVVSGSKRTQALEEDASVTVSQDVAQLEESLDSSDLPAHMITMAKTNLNAIKKDAEAISNGVEASRKSSLAQAIKLRMQALKKMLAAKPLSSFEAESNVPATHSNGARVLKDVKEIESALAFAHISSSRKQEALQNLQAIKKDAEEMSVASPKRAQALKQAMDLRMTALDRELN